MHIYTHNNEIESLTFTKIPDLERKTRKRPKPKIEKLSNYGCAYVTVMAVLIIFPLIFQSVINLRMLTTEGWGK